MREQVGQALAWIDGRTPRERFLMLLTAGASVWVLWSGLVMDPLVAEREALKTKLDDVVAQVVALENQSRQLARQLAESPDAENRRKEVRLSEEIQALEARLKHLDLGIVPASEAVRVLEELLDREKDLALVSMETRPAASAFPETLAGGDDSPAALYRHDLVLELEGTYLGTLRYLRAVQELPWRIYWDELHLEVEEHPTARVTLRLHTLSFGEAWIGV